MKSVNVYLFSFILLVGIVYSTFCCTFDSRNKTKTKNVMNNAINTLQLFEGPYQFDSIQTELNITADFIFYKLAKQYEYRETNKDLWAILTLGGVQTRYVLDYKNFGLVKKQTKVTSGGKIHNTTTRIFCGI